MGRKVSKVVRGIMGKAEEQLRKRIYEEERIESDLGIADLYDSSERILFKHKRKIRKHKQRS